jgi:UDP-N-acetylglucosamine 2-epimerase
MLAAIKGCTFIVTDSGGIQREAYYLKKRCLIPDMALWWPILVMNEIHSTISTDEKSIRIGLEWVENALTRHEYPVIDYFGEGKASEEAVRSIVRLSSHSV